MRWPGSRAWRERWRNGKPPEDKDLVVMLGAAGVFLLIVCGVCCAIVGHALRDWLTL